MSLPAVYELGDKPSLLSQKLIVDQIHTSPGAPSPLAPGILEGGQIYLQPRPVQSLLQFAGGLQAKSAALPPLPNAESGSSLLQWMARLPAISPASTPAKATPSSLATVVQTDPAKKGDSVARLVGAVTPGAIANTSLHLVTFSQDATLAQVTAHLESFGLQSTTAGSAADRIFDLLNNHAANAVMVAVAAGSSTVAVLQLLRPGMRRRTKWGIAALVGTIAGLLFYFFGVPPNPLAGKWVASPAEARYEYGTAPQSAMRTIEAQGARLTVTLDEMRPEGGPHHLNYELDTDAKEHPVPAETGANTAVAELKGRSLDAVFKQNGTVVRRESWKVSADWKEMTVTVTGQAPNGEAFTNRSIFEKK